MGSCHTSRAYDFTSLQILQHYLMLYRQDPAVRMHIHRNYWPAMNISCFSAVYGITFMDNENLGEKICCSAVKNGNKSRTLRHLPVLLLIAAF